MPSSSQLVVAPPRHISDFTPGTTTGLLLLAFKGRASAEVLAYHNTCSAFQSAVGNWLSVCALPGGDDASVVLYGYGNNGRLLPQSYTLDAGSAVELLRSDDEGGTLVRWQAVTSGVNLSLGAVLFPMTDIAATVPSRTLGILVELAALTNEAAGLTDFDRLQPWRSVQSARKPMAMQAPSAQVPPTVHEVKFVRLCSAASAASEAAAPNQPPKRDHSQMRLG